MRPGTCHTQTILVGRVGWTQVVGTARIGKGGLAEVPIATTPKEGATMASRFSPAGYGRTLRFTAPITTQNNCAILIIAATGLSIGSGNNALIAAPGRVPNIVVILVDDMGYGDIGPFGSKLNRTPSLDRMATEGMKLTASMPRRSARRRGHR